jgi:hypothetical protein
MQARAEAERVRSGGREARSPSRFEMARNALQSGRGGAYLVQLIHAARRTAENQRFFIAGTARRDALERVP